MAEGEFLEELLFEEARQATGFSDFGDPGFREGLGVLLDTYRTTADFTERGHRRYRRRLVQLLATRLRIQAALTKHPEVRDREIRRPLYLTGLPRTGTSALFNLLGEDPAARPLLLWEAIFPDPAENLEPGQTDPRYEALKAHYDRGREKHPEFTKIHYVGADRPEECVLLLALDFCDVQMGIEPLIEPYASWFQRQDLRRPYAYYRDVLKLLDWQRPGERWLLKSPAHLWALDVLVEMFPDACIILTHRNPLEAIASACSLTDALMDARAHHDSRDLGPLVLEYYTRSLERGLAVREQLDPNRFHDVRYAEFVADPLKAAAGIYQHFGLPFTPDAQQAMRGHAAEHTRAKHGEHEYSLEQYGLTPARVKDRLAAYIDRYDLLTD